MISTATVSGWFMKESLNLMRSPGPKQARASFVASNLYLFTLLAAILAQGLADWVV